MSYGSKRIAAALMVLSTRASCQRALAVGDLQQADMDIVTGQLTAHKDPRSALQAEG